jgi:antitoxin ParD1/3/4
MAPKLTSMNVSLPAALRDFVRQRVERGGFANASEYMRDLIRREVESSKRSSLEELLREGLESGPATPMTDADWDDLRRSARAAAKAHKRKRA